MEEYTKATATEPDKAPEVESPMTQKEFTEAIPAPESATETEKESEKIADDSKKNAIQDAKTTETVGLVFSIFGLVFGVLFLGGGILSLGCSILGLCLSVSGGKRLRAFGEPAGKATAGLVLGVIGLAVFGIACLFGVLLLFGIIGAEVGLEGFEVLEPIIEKIKDLVDRVVTLHK